MINESGVEVPFFLRKSFEGDEIPQDDTNMKELFWYMRNCAVGSMAKKLDHTLISSIRRLNIEFTSKVKMKKKGSVEEPSIQNRKELIKIIKKNRDFPKGSDFEKNLSFAKQEFDLDDIDIKILTLILLYKRNHKIELFSDLVLKRLQNAVSAVAALLNVESDCVKKKISAEGNLSTSGLIKINEYSNDRDFSGDGGCFQISSHFSQVMGQSYTTRKKLVEALIGKPVTTSLTWDDFEHLGEIRNLVAKVVLGGKRQSATGINILLYGPVGTGKTEFAKALAAHVSQTIWSVGETDDVGGEPMRGERIDMLKILQKLLSRKKDAILLFDEAEDILSSERDWFGSFSRSSRQSKVYLNRIIEQSTIPVIWTCNDVETIHPAILRRMTMAIEVKTSGRSSQEKIWKSALEHADFNLSQDAIMRLAERYAAPASVISNALKVGKLSKGGEAEVEEAMTSVLRMLNIIPNIAEPNIAAFEPKLVNSESNLVHLVE